MEVTSYLLEEEEELEACLAAIEPEEMECHDLLVQIFSVSMKKKEFVHVTGLIKKKFPRAKVIGGKVAACISGGRGMDSGISLTFMRFMSSEVHLFGLRLDDNERAIGKDTCMDWLEGRKDLAALEVLTIGHINTLSSIFAGKIWVPLFGGLLGDSTGGKEGFIYCDGEILKHGLLLVALCGQHLQVHVERSSGWLPLGPLMTITKVNGPYIVSELDGQPFEHVYSHYIGDLEGETFLDKSLLFPIVLHRESGLIARHPLLCHEDGSAEFGAGFQVGDLVQFGYGNPQHVIHDTQEMQQRMAEFHPQGLFLADCLARWLLMEGNVESELKNCRLIAPSFGFYGYGELVHGRSSMMLHNMTLVLAGIKETDTEELHLRAQFMPDHIPLTRQQQYLSHLVHFVQQTTSELEALNGLLGRKAQTDDLTGLYNKGQIESILQEAIKQEAKNPRGVCLMMIDADNFKHINDHFGHDTGDVALKTIAQVLTEHVRNSDAVGRWGGDEFWVILRETDGEGASNVAARIKESLAQYHLPDGSNYSLSIGITAAIKGDTQETFFHRADQALYQAKATPGKNATVVI